METFLQSSRTRAAVSLRRRVVLAGPVQLCGGGSCASRGGCAGQPALLLGARAAASATFVARSSSVRLASVSAEGGGADARLDGHDNLLSAMERDLLSNRFVDAAKKALFALKAGTDVEDERAKQILKGLVVSGKYGMAVRFFETHAGETSRLGYSSAHFAVVAYANLGRVGEVFKTIEDMREKGMRPNRATLTSAITALYKCSKQRRGLAAAHAAYRLWSEVQALEEGLDEGAARAGLLACVATGRMDEASSLAERWCRERPEWQSARTLNPVAQALARGGGGAGARRALAWMRGCGVEPDDATWNALVDAAVDGGGSGAAEEVLGMAEAAGARVGVWGWNALVKGLASEGRLGEAQGVLDRMWVAGAEPNHVTYGILMAAAAKGGGAGQCREIFEDAAARGVSFGAPEWNALIAAQAREAGPGVDDAFRTLGRMVHAGVQPTAVTYNTLMAACAREGDHASVVHLFSTMEEAGIQPDAASYASLMRAHAGAGDMAAAEGALARLKASPGAALDAVPLCVLIDGYASRRGDLGRAEAALEELLSLHKRGRLAGPGPESWGPKAFGALMKGYRRERDLEGALSVVQRMVGLGLEPDMRALDGLVDLCILTGNWRKAAGVVRAMEAAGHLTPAQEQRCRELLGRLERGEREVRDVLYRRGRPMAGLEVERAKFWLGLPNRYYSDTGWP